MIYATQDQVYRAVRERLKTVLGLPDSRVYLSQEPVFAEAMDFAVQITPLSGGAQNELNRTGLGFVTERFAVTTIVRVASDNSVKASRLIAGDDKGVITRASEVRKALIQHGLTGLLRIDIRFVSSGAVRRNPVAPNFAMMTDVYVCSYALPWPIVGQFVAGWDDGTPTFPDLDDLTVNYNNTVVHTVTVTGNPIGPAPIYLWFAFPEDMHNRGIVISTPAGVEPFYRLGFPPPSGPSLGTGIIVESGVTYYLYRRAYPTTAPSLTYTITAI